MEPNVHGDEIIQNEEEEAVLHGREAHTLVSQTKNHIKVTRDGSITMMEECCPKFHRICRMCWEKKEYGRLVSPCNCRGTSCPTSYPRRSNNGWRKLLNI